jgi:hypothetical protein
MMVLFSMVVKFKREGPTPRASVPAAGKHGLVGLTGCCMLLCCYAQNGQAPLSDLQCTTSSEALLAGKAPTFRLLVWAIDRHTGE